METLNDYVTSNLTEAFIKSFSDKGFDPTHFSKLWFPQSSQYYFLFKKNLKVTNISHAELLALLKSYTVFTPTGQTANDLQFISYKEFKRTIAELIKTFPYDNNNRQRMSKTISALYADLLCRTVIVDSYFGSAAVCLPSHMDFDLASICGKSGYIHSAGKIVFIRNMAKASKDEFFEDMSKHLCCSKSKNKKTFFAVYAHEDFTPFDRKDDSELRNGLNDVKLFVEKCYMGPTKLVGVINEMRTKFANALFIPDAGNFKKRHDLGSRDKNVSDDKAIWLLIDQNINGANIRIPGEESFFICYEQEYLNSNPCHIFDENKPAWIAHTTLPHSLAAAMISISKPYWPKEGNIDIADPFAGSGTIYFESRKFSRANVYCGDRNSLMERVITDNSIFLSQDNSIHSGCISNLKRLYTILSSNKEDLADLDYQLLSLANKYVRALDNNNKTAEKRILSKLNEVHEKDRLIFYIGLRIIRRHETALERRGSSHWIPALQKEVGTLLRQMKSLQKLYKAKIISTKGVMTIRQSMYSLASITDTNKAYGGAKLEGCILKNTDARNIPENTFDVIVTDPPYGINTIEEREELAMLYRDMCEAWIKALKSDGQIIICLPEQMRTGQDFPFFTHKEIVIQQMLSAARNAGREIINPSYSVPKIQHLYRPPFYWDSDRALRRAILHFRIRKTVGSA